MKCKVQESGSKGGPNLPAIKVGICTPTAGIVHAQYTMSLLRLVLYFLSTPLINKPEEQKRHVVTQMQLGANIGSNRDNMVDICLAQNCTHILFIDDDMGFTPECLNILLSREMPMVLANYRRKIPPGHFTAYTAKSSGIEGQQIITNAQSTSLVECGFGGFGFCLIEAEVLRKIKKPRFMMEWLPEVQDYSTEDFPFFRQVHEAGYPTYVDQEVSKRVWHCGTFNYSFDQELKPEWATPYPERRISSAV